jgi:hypothetical protein
MVDLSIFPGGGAGTKKLHPIDKRSAVQRLCRFLFVV